MVYPSQTIKAITEFVFIGVEKRDILPSDLVIVLGNEFIEGTVAEIYDLYQIGLIREDARIILSGATGTIDKDKDLECNRLYDCAVNEFCMNKELFIKEPQATNTYLNFLYSKEIICRKGGFEKYSNILCIGKAFLLRRASMYAAKAGYPESKMQYYGTVDVNGKNIGKYTWWQREDSVMRVLAEIKRIGEYGMKGDLSIY